MTSRRFTDALGVEWMVLHVKPALTERRSRKDRRVKNVGPKPGQPDRRKGQDRRRGSDTGPRVRLDPNLAPGWLAFEGGGERRRLTPVPSDWLTLSDQELRQLLAEAALVSRRPRPSGE